MVYNKQYHYFAIIPWLFIYNTKYKKNKKYKNDFFLIHLYSIIYDVSK